MQFKKQVTTLGNAIPSHTATAYITVSYNVVGGQLITICKVGIGLESDANVLKAYTRSHSLDTAYCQYSLSARITKQRIEQIENILHSALTKQFFREPNKSGKGFSEKFHCTFEECQAVIDKVLSGL